MGKKASSGPDPAVTAMYQAQMNQNTAMTQQAMNMVDQYNPWGAVEYEQTGSSIIPGANGQLLEVPKYKQTTTYTPEQQAVFDQTTRAQGALAQTAAQQSEFLRDYLTKTVDLKDAPALNTPTLQTSIGGNYQNTFGEGYNTNFSGDLGANYNSQFNQQLGDDYKTSYAGADDFSADRQKYEDALMARMQPSMQQNEDALRNKLINQGIRPGSAAWNSEMSRMSAANTDTRMAAILNAGTEQSRMVGLAQNAAQFGNQASLQQAQFGSQQQQAQNDAAMQQAAYASAMQEAQNAAVANQTAFGNDASAASANFANNAAAQQAQLQNAARSQYVDEAYTARNQPFNEIASLLSSSQIANPGQMSSATPQTQVAGVDYTGLVNAQANREAQSQSGMMGGVAGILGGLIKMSDRRSKKDIRLIGKIREGVNLYEFRYKTDDAHAPMRQGPMSDEVRAVMPWAVSVDTATGFDMVNYSAVMGCAS